MAGFEKYYSEDKKLINPDTLHYYCCSNEALIPGGCGNGVEALIPGGCGNGVEALIPGGCSDGMEALTPGGCGNAVKALVLEFPGLGGGSCLGGSMDNLSVYDTPFTRACAEKGIVVAYMFPGPWSWMNRGAVRVTDLVVNAFMKKYGWLTDDDFSLVVMGGSMGGQSALIYSIDSAHKVNACVAHCPCYGISECFSVVDPFPRTFISAVNAYDMPLGEALQLISPGCRVDELPDIPYLITADEFDEIIPLDGLEKYVERVKKAGRSVQYMRLAGQPHGGISLEDRRRLDEFVMGNSNGI